MKKIFIKSLVFIVPLFFLTWVTMAQGIVKGKIIDSQTKEELVGATVMVEGTTQGAAASLDGTFTLNTSEEGAQTLIFRCVGYKELKKNVQIGTQPLNLGTIAMQTEAIGLGDVTVTASVAVQRKTPVAVAVIEPTAIENKLSTQEFPEILKSTPSVYATKEGGGYGDSRINLRGFSSENIAVMINGVPVNGMENGKVYWSNWAGLSDVTRSMQVQRGLGASKVSVPSVGGSINILTKTTDVKEGGSVSYAVGNDGYNKISFNVSTGLRNGWAISFLGAKTWGDGYIQGTNFDGYSYFANISKQLGNHQFSLTAFGAPQKHFQRSSYDKLTIEGWKKLEAQMGPDRQYRYNPTYGFGPGNQQKSAYYNVYHKPQISLNHFWQINEKSSLSSVVYVSIGRGYGHSGQGYNSEYSNGWYGSNSGVINNTYRNTDGTFAYDQIYKMNSESENGSLMVIGKLLNHHDWYGLLSTYTTTVARKIDLSAGIDFRYYKGVHRLELSDLFGGAYYCDVRYRSNVKVANNAAAADPNFVNQKLGIGDVIYRDYDGYIAQGGAFFQAEYNSGPLSTFVAGSISNSSYWMRNHFYYDKAHEKSSTESFLGWTAKGGANYNLNEHHNVFANIGYISRAPFYSSGVFLNSNTSNATNPEAVNEKTFSVELGYGFRSSMFSANLNLYRTAWLDKTMARSSDITLADGTTDRWSINMQGVDALHQGIELDFVLRPVNWLRVNGMFSIGDWKWNSVATGYFYNSAGQPLAKSDGTVASGVGADDHAKAIIDLDGVRVGNSAQTTFALGASVEPLRGLHIGGDYSFWGRNYADFSISTNDLGFGAKKKYESPWRIPSAGELDMNMNYRFKMGKLGAVIYANVNNVLDNITIADALDGSDHDWKTARVFYRFGRTYSVRLKINF